MIKLGNQDITLKIGSADVSAAYLGSVLVYSGGTPPTPSFDGKWLATYSDSHTESAQCDASSAITSGEITLTYLVSVEIGQCVTTISATTFKNCSSLTSVTIGSGVTSIRTQAFYGCTSLTSATIPDSVTIISSSTFYNCTSLTSVTLGSGVTSIGSSAFQNCTSLTSVTIPSGVTSIGGNAFNGCSDLTSVTVLATTPPTLGGSRVFDDTNDCPIYVPSQSVSAYKSAARWSTYASRIQAIPTPSPQWVTFNSGDDISGLNVYGVKGVANNLSNTFGSELENICFELSRNIVNAIIGDYSNPCYTDTYGINDNVELIFGNIGCSDYYTLPASRTASSTIQLYIYQ